MIGPLVLAILGAAAGWVAAGPAGAVGGLLLAASFVAVVAVGAVVWVRRIGTFLDIDDAWEVAPCPPGFAVLCGAVYERLLVRENPDSP